MHSLNVLRDSITVYWSF